MNHNPIQIVLNPNNYIFKDEQPPGGGHTDFYQDRDQEYVAHKQSLLRQVESVASLLRSSQNPFTTVKVELNQAALAKSHRPLQCLFQSNKSPLIGAIGIGNLLFQANLSSLEWLHDKILGSEEVTTRVLDKHNQMKVKPSTAKSEVGAIAKIFHYGADEKVAFAVEDAVAWLKKNSVSRGYVVETIAYVENTTSGYELRQDSIQKAKMDLVRQFNLLGSGLIASKICKTDVDANYLYIRLLLPETKKFIINLDDAILDSKAVEGYADFNPSRHALLLKILRDSPLVRSVSLPPELSKSEISTGDFAGTISLPVKTVDTAYPKVALIDSGVKNEYLREWCPYISNGFDPDDCDPHHGSQVASLLIAGKSMNPAIEGLEEDGCLVYDIWIPIHKDKNSFIANFDGYGEFFDWLDFEVGVAVSKGVRIFNLSLNLKEYVKDESYSFAASQIDRISHKHNAIFVISAGNLRAVDYRGSWPAGIGFPSDIDRLAQPAEAITAVTVGALNPPGCDRNIQGAPTIYTRRGPGVSMGVKPDVAHYGGFVQRTSATSGLVSLNGNGVLIEESGTSFSAPLVAKILASLDYRTRESLNRNTLIAILIHHSTYTESLRKKEIPSAVRRRYVGFGLPSNSGNSLVTDDHAITIVFEAIIKRKEIVKFDFVWPSSLVKNGKCSGDVTLTLVYDGVVDSKFGGEYCRVNVDASLQQETVVKGEWAYRKKCDSIWEDRVGKEKNFEKNQIDHGLKWWPVKKYHKYSKSGIGESTNWRLKIDSVERGSGDFPPKGISVCAILTIQDPGKKSPNLFNEVRQHLASIGVEVKPVEVAQQIIVKTEA